MRSRRLVASLPAFGAPLAAAFLLAAPGDVPAPIRKGLETIRAEEAMAHVNFLASPELEGRDTGQRGCEAAAEYLAAQLERSGLAPLGDEVNGKRTFLQHYPIHRVSIEAKSAIQVAAEGAAPRELVFGRDVAPVGAFSRVDVVLESRIVDGGDLAVPPREPAASATGSAPASRPRGPRGPAMDPPPIPAGSEGALVLFRVSGVAGRLPTTLTVAAMRAARDSKAAGVLLAMGPKQEKAAWEAAFKSAADSLREAQVSLTPVTPPRAQPGGVVLLVAPGVALDGLAGAKAAVSLKHKREATSATNVVALWKGSDPELSKEHVVFSAHYDHVGIQRGLIHPGADDNASGTSALLEIAEAFAKTDPPRRSVVILAVSGEEKRLWGSSHFVDHAPVPRESIVANLNTDMVGRTLLNGKQLPGYMLMTPSKTHPGFNTLASRALELGPEYGFPDMPSGDIYWERSDHYNFAKHGIPVMFLCNGEHEDYHGPGDTPDKIDPDKIARSAKLTFQLGYEAASAKERPRVLSAK